MTEKETTNKELTRLIGVYRKINPKHTLFLGLFLNTIDEMLHGVRIIM